MQVNRSLRFSMVTLVVLALAVHACETPTEAISVASVETAPLAATRYPGQTVQLVATTKDGSGNTLVDRTVTWSTNNAAAATVSATGLVTAVAVGTATITATSEGVTGNSTITVAPVPVDSVSVTPAAATRHISQTVQLTATTFDSAGGTLTGRTVNWSSSNPAVATVSGTGLVTALALGTTTITATSEGVNGTSAITVTPVPVDSVSVTPVSATRHIGQTVQLTATPRDSAGGVLAGRTVTWSSSNPAVATVSVTGLVTAVALGTSTITATSEGVNGTSAISVTPVPVDSVSVTPSAATRLIGQTAQFTAATFDSAGGALAGRVIAWSSSNPAVATVDSSGSATAVGVGVANIIATSEGVSANGQLTVTLVPVDSVLVTPAAATKYIGQTQQYTATPVDSAMNPLPGRSVTWTSSDTTKATVSVSGLVTAVSAGTVSITATSEGKSGTSSFTAVIVPVDSVVVSPAAATRLPTQTVQLTATTLDSVGGVLAGRSVAWTTSDSAIATVNASGLVTAHAVGGATITATSEGKSGTASITVNAVPVASVLISPDTLLLVEGDSSDFDAIARDSTGATLAGRSITWQSLDAGVATVDSSGGVVAVSEGVARIVATSEGKPDTAIVVVSAEPETIETFDIAVTAFRDNGQGVATDGTNALFAVQSGTGGGASNTNYVRLVDSTGTPITGLTAIGNLGDPPAVAYGGGTYLVATWKPGNTANRATLAWLVSAAGAVTTGPLGLASGDAANAVCGAEYSGGTFVVTYMKTVGVNSSGDSLTAVFGRLISTTGTVSSEFQVSDGFGSCSFALNGMVAGDGTQFLAAWAVVDSASASDGAGARVRTISNTGTLGSVTTVRSTTVLGRVLSVAARAGGGWVVGLGELVDEPSANFDAYFQLLMSNGALDGAAVTVETGATSTIPTVGEWDDGFVLMFVERTAVAADQAVKLRRYNAAGAAQGADITLAEQDGAGKVPVALAIAGSSRLVVLIEFFTPGANVMDFDQATGDVRGVWVRP